MPYLLVLLSIFYHGHASITSSSTATIAGSQFDETSQTVSIDESGNIGQNIDTLSQNGGDHVRRYPVSTWPQIFNNYPYRIPYYDNSLLFNGYGPYSLNGIDPAMQRLPFGTPILPQQRINPYLWRNTFTGVPTDSDIQFSYLMGHPHAAMAYQGMIFKS
uniref:Secreted protein n=1 Tax=Haemonchus contortus TaxID=6289 RepID=A0A7I4YMX1_HAECO|nr:unnamed protein product [Haemonchus contortus]